MKKRIAAAMCVLLTAASALMSSTINAGAEGNTLGDITGDKVIDGRDATAVLTEYASQSAGKAKSFTDAQMKAADVNADGIVDGRDATIILTYYAKTSSGLTDSFEDYLASQTGDIVDRMSLHDKICQMFIVRPDELTNGTDLTSATQATRDGLEEYPVGGLIFFSDNMESREQVTDMIRTTKDYAAGLGCVPLFFGVDEEGGVVSRCAEKLGTSAFEPMYSYKDKGPVTAYANARKLAGDIGQFGFDLDFAPVADTWSNPDNKVIGTRAYSDDFEETAMLVGAAVRGFREGGVHCTLKHFPGHGDTYEDSHDGFAVSNRTLDELRSNEYTAFDRGIKAGADFVMVGHITVPAIDNLPASLSSKVINDELRGTLGYDGIVITDALAMGAIANAYSSSVCAVMAVEAGNDMLLSPKNLRESVAGIEDAVANGVISEERIDESVRRILKVKGQLE